MKASKARNPNFGFRISSFMCVVFLLFCFQNLSFSEDVIRVKARAWPERVTIGDEIRFYIQIDKASDITIEPLSPKTNLSPFEIKKIEVLPQRQKSGRAKETLLLTLTVFELGDLKIPPVVLHTKGGQDDSGGLLTKEVPVKVVSVGKQSTDKDDIRPIKGPVSFDLRWFWNILIGVLAFLMAVLLVVKVVLRIRKQKLIDLENRKPPHERAFLELERLRKKEFLEYGKTKEFYSEFADILRRYLERRFEIETLELTTAEILEAFKKKEFDRMNLEKMKDILENADLVKFAKFTPPRALEQRFSEALVSFVENTKLVPGAPRKK